MENTSGYLEFQVRYNQELSANTNMSTSTNGFRPSVHVLVSQEFCWCIKKETSSYWDSTVTIVITATTVNTIITATIVNTVTIGVTATTVNSVNTVNSVKTISQEFCSIMKETGSYRDLETGYKEAFRAFSRDEEGCIPAEEIK